MQIQRLRLILCLFEPDSGHIRYLSFGFKLNVPIEYLHCEWHIQSRSLDKYTTFRFSFQMESFHSHKIDSAFFHNINNRLALLSTNINIEIQAQYCWFFCGEFFYGRFFVKTLFLWRRFTEVHINYIKSPNQKHLNSMCIVFFVYKIRIVKKVLLW